MSDSPRMQQFDSTDYGSSLNFPPFGVLQIARLVVNADLLMDGLLAKSTLVACDTPGGRDPRASWMRTGSQFLITSSCNHKHRREVFKTLKCRVRCLSEERPRRTLQS